MISLLQEQTSISHLILPVYFFGSPCNKLCGSIEIIEFLNYVLYIGIIKIDNYFSLKKSLIALTPKCRTWP